MLVNKTIQNIRQEWQDYIESPHSEVFGRTHNTMNRLLSIGRDLKEIGLDRSALYPEMSAEDATAQLQKDMTTIAQQEWHQISLDPDMKAHVAMNRLSSIGRDLKEIGLDLTVLFPSKSCMPTTAKGAARKIKRALIKKPGATWWLLATGVREILR